MHIHKPQQHRIRHIILKESKWNLFFFFALFSCVAPGTKFQEQHIKSSPGGLLNTPDTHCCSWNLQSASQMTLSLSINSTDEFTLACSYYHNADRNVLLFCFTNKTGSCTKTMSVSQILTEMQLCKLRGWHICDSEELQPDRILLHLGDAQRTNTWQSLTSSSGTLLRRACQRTVFTQEYITASRLNRRLIPLGSISWFCKLLSALPIPHSCPILITV